jgi:hypothetical protein
MEQLKQYLSDIRYINKININLDSFKKYIKEHNITIVDMLDADFIIYLTACYFYNIQAQIDIFKYLIDIGVDIKIHNYTGRYYSTTVYYALYNNIDILKFLLENGCKIIPYNQTYASNIITDYKMFIKKRKKLSISKMSRKKSIRFALDTISILKILKYYCNIELLSVIHDKSVSNDIKNKVKENIKKILDLSIESLDILQDYTDYMLTELLHKVTKRKINNFILQRIIYHPKSPYIKRIVTSLQ